MESDGLAGFVWELEPAVFNHSGKKLAVVLDLEVCAERGILVFESIEAVGAMGKHSANAMSLQPFDVRAGKLLEQTFLTHTASRIARAAFSFSKHTIIDVQMVEDSNHRAAHRPSIRVEAPRTADPVEQFDLLPLIGKRNIQAAGPCNTIGIF